LDIPDKIGGKIIHMRIQRRLRKMAKYGFKTTQHASWIWIRIRDGENIAKRKEA
jgi:hypothetical protein